MNGIPFDYQHEEVRWYRSHGKYQTSRLRFGGDGREYVIGDHAWNTGHRDKPEEIERQMRHALFKLSPETKL